MNTRPNWRLDILVRALRGFGRDTTGVTAVEYAVIAGGIAMAIVAAVAAVGANVTGHYQAAADGLADLIN